MIEKHMDDDALERIYDGFADALDGVSESKRLLLVTKLAFALANLVGDTNLVMQALSAARRDL